MSLKDIQLPDFVLAEIYKNDIVSTKPSVPINTAQISFLGNNKKNIVIFTEDKNAVHINDERLNFLSAILQACHLTLADVAIVNIVNQSPLQYQNITEQLKPKFILLFNVNVNTIGLSAHILPYQINNINDCAIISASSLDEMLANTQEAKIEKSKLWLSLKNMFNI